MSEAKMADAQIVEAARTALRCFRRGTSTANAIGEAFCLRMEDAGVTERDLERLGLVAALKPLPQAGGEEP